MINTAEKIKKILYNICELLELLAAALVIVGVIISIAGFFRDGSLFQNILHFPGGLIIYLERVFTVVIGIEFLQMLSKPNTDNVIEILIFLEARHMIVEETTPVQDLISILGITILIILRWMAHDIRRRRERQDKDLGNEKKGEKEELE